jgi:hypothetical protein
MGVEIGAKFIFFDPNSGNVAGRNSSLCNFFFLKIVKIVPTNKVQSFF